MNALQVTGKRLRLLCERRGLFEVKRERHGASDDGLCAAQRALVVIVRTRFPVLQELALQRVGQLRQTERLAELSAQLATVPDERGARFILNSMMIT